MPAKPNFVESSFRFGADFLSQSASVQARSKTEPVDERGQQLSKQQRLIKTKNYESKKEIRKQRWQLLTGESDFQLARLPRNCAPSVGGVSTGLITRGHKAGAIYKLSAPRLRPGYQGSSLPDF